MGSFLIAFLSWENSVSSKYDSVEWEPMSFVNVTYITNSSTIMTVTVSNQSNTMSSGYIVLLLLPIIVISISIGFNFGIQKIEECIVQNHANSRNKDNIKKDEKNVEFQNISSLQSVKAPKTPKAKKDNEDALLASKKTNMSWRLRDAILEKFWYQKFKEFCMRSVCVCVCVCVCV